MTVSNWCHHCEQGIYHRFPKHGERTRKPPFVVSGPQLTSHTQSLHLCKRVRGVPRDPANKTCPPGSNHTNMPETKGKFHELMNQLHNPQITFCGSIRVASSFWPHPCKRGYFLHLFEKKGKKTISPKNSKESQNIISISAALSGVTAKQKNCNKLTGQTWQLGNGWLLA